MPGRRDLQEDNSVFRFVPDPARPGLRLRPSKRQLTQREWTIPKMNWAAAMSPVQVVKSKGSGSAEYYDAPPMHVDASKPLSQQIRESPIPVIITSPQAQLHSQRGESGDESEEEEDEVEARAEADDEGDDEDERDDVQSRDVIEEDGHDSNEIIVHISPKTQELFGEQPGSYENRRNVSIENRQSGIGGDVEDRDREAGHHHSVDRVPETQEYEGTRAEVNKNAQEYRNQKASSRYISRDSHRMHQEVQQEENDDEEEEEEEEEGEEEEKEVEREGEEEEEEDDGVEDNEEQEEEVENEEEQEEEDEPQNMRGSEERDELVRTGKKLKNVLVSSSRTPLLRSSTPRPGSKRPFPKTPDVSIVESHPRKKSSSNPKSPKMAIMEEKQRSRNRSSTRGQLQGTSKQMKTPDNGQQLETESRAGTAPRSKWQAAHGRRAASTPRPGAVRARPPSPDVSMVQGNPTVPQSNTSGSFHSPSKGGRSARAQSLLNTSITKQSNKKVKIISKAPPSGMGRRLSQSVKRQVMRKSHTLMIQNHGVQTTPSLWADPIDRQQEAPVRDEVEAEDGAPADMPCMTSSPKRPAENMQAATPPVMSEPKGSTRMKTPTDHQLKVTRESAITDFTTPASFSKAGSFRKRVLSFPKESSQRSEPRVTFQDNLGGHSASDGDESSCMQEIYIVDTPEKVVAVRQKKPTGKPKPAPTSQPKKSAPKTAMHVWQPGGKKRRASNVTEIDVILECLQETATEYSADIDCGLSQFAITKLVKNMQDDLEKMIMFREEKRKMMSAISQVKTKSKRNREHLLSLQRENMRVRKEISTLRNDKQKQQEDLGPEDLEDIEKFLTGIRKFRT